jgi:hypothetical protein
MWYVRSEGVETAPMKDETVLFNAANNAFCVLNPTAAFLWNQLTQPQTLESLCSALASSYSNVSGAAVSSDVEIALKELQRTACVVAKATA